jgi:hypothetical protein
MALSKLEEWLHNKKSSFLRFRLNAELRTVHRRHIAFQVLSCGGSTCGHIHSKYSWRMPLKVLER